jgi:lipoprotein-anchoring transpeptidase ErfK/SrfK
MNRRSFLLSGLALAAFPVSAAAEMTDIRYNFQGRVWGSPAPLTPQPWSGNPRPRSPQTGHFRPQRWQRDPYQAWGSRGSSYGGKEIVAYDSREKPGTIIINTGERRLYYVLGGGQAIRYGVGVGRQGFEWSGVAKIGGKREWPAWHPPADMIQRELVQYGRQLPSRMEGGPGNPLGARALYLYQGSQDTLYRIHGTNDPRSIGLATSSGCIRMLNDEVIDLYERAGMGAKVIVL